MSGNEATQIDDGSRVVNLRQRYFLRYTVGILLYLAIINLCDEYWEWISIDSFTVSMLVAILLVIGLAFLIWSEGKVADHFKSKPGASAKILRGITSYIILVGGKFLLMGMIALAFGARVTFSGPFHGAVAFVGLVAAILVADGVLKKIFLSLGSPA